MSRYNKRGYDDFRTRVSRKSYEEEDTIFDTFKRLIILGAAICLGGLVSLQAYLMMVPPIANLSDFRPNMVTTFYSIRRTAQTLDEIINALYKGILPLYLLP